MYDVLVELCGTEDPVNKAEKTSHGTAQSTRRLKWVQKSIRKGWDADGHHGQKPQAGPQRLSLGKPLILLVKATDEYETSEM
ncbi:MAG: hypothetical protein QXR65_08060 [Candidatus Bathyarchaeia archaeon]